MIAALTCLTMIAYAGETEMEHKRSHFTKTWYLGNNQYKTTISTKPIHYFNEIGEFREIPDGAERGELIQLAREQAEINNEIDNFSFREDSYSLFEYQDMEVETSYDSNLEQWVYDTTYVDCTGIGYFEAGLVGYQIISSSPIGGGAYVDYENWRTVLSWNLSDLDFIQPSNIYEVLLKIKHLGVYIVNTNIDYIVEIGTMGNYQVTDNPDLNDYTAVGNANYFASINVPHDYTSWVYSSSFSYTNGTFFDSIQAYIGENRFTLGVKHDTESYNMSNESNHTTINESEITVYYTLPRVTLINQLEGNNQSNLGDTLSLDNVSGGQDFLNQPSGSSVPVMISDNYNIKTHKELLQNGIDSVKHHHWGFNGVYTMFNPNFIMRDDFNQLDALFIEQKTIMFSTPEETQMEIQDPWYVREDGTQTGVDWVEINTQTDQYNAFLGQGGEIESLTPPYYTLQAQTAYNDGPICYEFDQWSVNPANGATFSDITNYLTPVIYNTPGAVITAHYRTTNALTGNISGGALPDGYYFYGDVVINSYTYVPSGSFFGVMPGTNITINDGGSGLRIYGDFEAVGTPRQPITFTGDGGLGIQISGEGSSEFRHSRFEGIMVESQITELGECVFDQCSFSYNNNIALSAYGRDNSTEINNCSITNSAYGMISGLYSTLKIMNTDFRNNDIGIYSLLNDESEIRFNTFTNNGTGLFTTAGSIPYLWKESPGEWLCDRENNVFTGNNTAVMAEFNSFPVLGFHPAYFNNDYGVSGWNRFYDNNTDIVNNNDFTVFAVGNNWYAPNPPGVVGCSESSPDNNVGNVQWQPTVYGLVGNNVIFPPDVPVLARQAEGEGDIARALSLYDDMVINKENVSAVYGVARCLWQQGDVPGILNKMDQYSQMFPNSPIEEQSLSIMTSYKLYLSGSINLNEALQTIDYIKLNYPDTELDPKLLFEQAKIEEDLQGNAKMIAGFSDRGLPEKAKQAYTTLAEKYPDTPYGMLASIMIGKQAKETAETIPAVFALHPAFPNPFNPVTTIKYDLPKSSRIELTVFNIMGQEIITLANGFREAGIHTVTWNGINNHNEPVSSGMYLVRLVTPGSVQTQKLVLMK